MKTAGLTAVMAALLFTVFCWSSAIAEDQPAAAKGVVKGLVTFNGNPVANAAIKISGKRAAKTKTNDKGEFSFKDMVPGEYTLNAEGAPKNRTRKGTASVIVPEPPGIAEPITVELE